MPSISTSKKLLDLCEFIVDCEHKTASTQETGYPSIRTPNIGKGRLILEGVNLVSEEVYRDWTKRAVPVENDLVLAREAPAGNVAILPKEPKVCLGQRTVLIRPNKKQVEPRYLVYLLLSDFMQHRILSFSGGATVAHVNMKDIRALKMPTLPKIDKQRTIGSILSAYDDLIENNTRRIKILEEMARLIYREWFVEWNIPVETLGRDAKHRVSTENKIRLRKATPEEKKVTGKDVFPEGWEVKEFGDIVSNQRETTNAGEHLLRLPYVPIDIIPRKTLSLLESKPGSDAQSSLIRFLKNDILFGAMRAYFHKIVIAPFDGVTRSTCFVLRPKKLELFSYSVLTTFQETTVAYASTHSRGSTMPYAVWSGVLEKMPAIMPSKDVYSKFDELVRPILDRLVGFYYIQNNLRQTRDLLLPKLISDEVKV